MAARRALWRACSAATVQATGLGCAGLQGLARLSRPSSILLHVRRNQTSASATDPSLIRSFAIIGMVWVGAAQLQRGGGDGVRGQGLPRPGPSRRSCSLPDCSAQDSRILRGMACARCAAYCEASPCRAEG